MKITFLGAAETVTGSSYLLESGTAEDGIKIMIDHGLFQGPNVEDRNYNDYELDPADIDYLLLTHAHIDHCGLIPKLVNRGFRGEILCTRETAELIDLLLVDSAKVQGYQAQETGKVPLYSADDAHQALSQVQTVVWGHDYDLTGKSGYQIGVKYLRAGHILGASSIQLMLEGKVITFSGDIGRETQDVIESFDRSEKVSDYIVMESLYGGKFHQNKDEMIANLAKEINRVLDRNGNVIIPAFAVQRTQEVLFDLGMMLRKGVIRKSVQIVLDSPLAQRVSRVYTDNLSELYSSGEVTSGKLSDYMYNRNLKIVKSTNESKKMKKRRGQIIVSGSGMCNGGRVVGYLKSMISDPKNMVAIVGFQAEETLGRELISGAKTVMIDDEPFDVNAEIVQFNGFSAHGDQQDLMDWLGTFESSRIKEVFLVHAEVEQSESFRQVLSDAGVTASVPRYLSSVEL